MGRGQKAIFLEVQELKEMLGLDEKYNHFPMFKKRILENSQKRLNMDTDLNFTYQIIKKGKTVLGIEFYMSQNKISTSPTAKEQYVKIEKIVPETIKNNDERFDKLFHKLCPIVNCEWKVSIKMLNELIRNYSEQEIMIAYNLTEKALEKGNIENIAGYFIKAVKEKFVDVQAEKKKQETEKRAKTKAQEEETKQKQLKQEVNKKAIVEQEQAEMIEFLEQNKDFEQVVFNEFLNSFVGKNSKVKTISDIFKSPMCKGIFLGIAKQKKDNL